MTMECRDKIQQTWHGGVEFSWQRRQMSRQHFARIACDRLSGRGLS